MLFSALHVWHVVTLFRREVCRQLSATVGNFDGKGFKNLPLFCVP
jgi:hypothetical protein